MSERGIVALEPRSTGLGATRWPLWLRLTNAAYRELQRENLFARPKVFRQDKADIKRLPVELDIYFRNANGAVRHAAIYLDI